MNSKVGARNPYIAGRALGQERGFFGRADILRLVETKLGTEDQNALVLFGQRRIGKTSILLQLKNRLPSPPFLPVYFDLMDCAQKPLSQVLFDLASTIAQEAIAQEAEMQPPQRDQFDDQGIFFRREFLPLLYQALGEEQSPILLFDEFDVLDMKIEEQLPSTAATQAFFPYLRELLEGEPRLKFVFVVGRRAEDLSINVKATFKSALYQRVSVLDQKSTRELIGIAEAQRSLQFTPDAVNRIIALTNRHPYLTQLLCQILWDNAHANNAQGSPVIDVPAIEAAALTALDSGQNIFEWIWDGLPPAERVIFAGIAELTDEQSVVAEAQLIELLQSHRIRILNRELELAPRALVEWEMLEQTEGGYRFFIELMRRWVATRRPISQVKDETDRIHPLADMLFQLGNAYYKRYDTEGAQSQLRQALKMNPNHFKARLLLGQILFEEGDLSEAIQELEEAYRYDEKETRLLLVRALLAKAEQFEGDNATEDTLAAYDRILDLSPHEPKARECRAAIWAKRGDDAVLGDDLAAALEAYQKADAQEKIQQIEALQHEREKLVQLYAKGMSAVSQRQWALAIRALADVVYIQPSYEEAAAFLSQAVKKQKESKLFTAAQQDIKPPADLPQVPQIGKCPTCGAQNDPANRFCEQCGSRIEPTTQPVPTMQPAAAQLTASGPICPSCGAAMLPGETFCDQCGASLPVPAAPSAKAAPKPVRTEAVTEPPNICHSCGHKNEVSNRFCDICGSRLEAQPTVSPKATQVLQVRQSAPTQAARPYSAPLKNPRLVFPDGTELPLPTDKREIIVGREDPISGIFPEIDLNAYGGETGGVSRQHARLTYSDGIWAVIDLNSTNYTRVGSIKIDPGKAVPIKDQTLVQFGRVSVVFRD